MSNNIQKSEEEKSSTPKKRGRKLGSTTGPRPVAWSCAAIIDNALVHELIRPPAGTPTDQLDKFTEENAAEIFMENYGAEPDSIKGPIYDKKGGENAISNKKKETVDIVMPNLTAKREPAIFHGWKGTAYGVEGHDDIVYFMFGEEVNPNSNSKRKNVPTAKTVLKTAVEFTKQISAN